MSDRPKYLSPQEVAEMLSISPGTLRNWRSNGGGPPYVKLAGHLVRYPEADVIRWAEERRQNGGR